MLVRPPHKCNNFWQDMYFSYLHSHVITENNTHWSPDNHRIHQVSYEKVGLQWPVGARTNEPHLLNGYNKLDIFSHHSLKVKVQEGVWVLPGKITLSTFGTEYYFLAFLPTYKIYLLHYLSNISLHGRSHTHPYTKSLQIPYS